MDFNVDKITEDKKIIAKVNGALTTNTSPVLLEALESDLANISELVLDLKNMPYTSSAGVRVILLLLQHQNQQHLRLHQKLLQSQFQQSLQ